MLNGFLDVSEAALQKTITTPQLRPAFVSVNNSWASSVGVLVIVDIK